MDDKHKKIFKHFSNGITHNLILWIIYKEPIHGYGIMKKLDEFFDFENSNCDLKATSSKVYPILAKMEKNDLIIGEWKTSNNKQVKYYSITEDGEIVLNNVKSNMKAVLKNESWLNFIEDMVDRKIDVVNSDEECD